MRMLARLKLRLARVSLLKCSLWLATLISVVTLLALRYRSGTAWVVDNKNSAQHLDHENLLNNVIKRLNEKSKIKSKSCLLPTFLDGSNRRHSDSVSEPPTACKRIPPLADSCEVAEKLFFSRPPETCSWQSKKEICVIQMEPETRVKCNNVSASYVNAYCYIEPDVRVKCDQSSCPGAVWYGAVSHSTGLLEWTEYSSVPTLEHYLQDQIGATHKGTGKDHFGFAFLKCQPVEEEKGDNEHTDSGLNYDYRDDEPAEAPAQLLLFPPRLSRRRESSGARYGDSVSVNFLLLDSVSRSHFYRSLPKTVDRLRRLHSNSAASVFDFELLQSLKGRTYENLQALFSGEINETARPFGLLDMPPTPLHTEVLLGRLREAGYETVMSEDLCWAWEWGLVKDLLAHAPKLPIRRRWRKFRQALDRAQIDRVDAMLASCEVLRSNRRNDPFHGLPIVCYNGRHHHQYLLDYAMAYQTKMAAADRPYSHYLLLNTGHDESGRRIQTLDRHLAEWLGGAARLNNTLTILIADHGNSYGPFLEQSDEGRIELFHPVFMLLVPPGAAALLGAEKMAALQLNQRRLVSVLDLHHTLGALVPGRPPLPVAPGNRRYGVTPLGLLEPLGANRSCADVPRLQPSLCICRGFESQVANDSRNTLLAEFALGQLNNRIQQQFAAANPGQRSGFGRCARLVAERFGNVKESHEENEVVVTKLDLFVRSKAAADTSSAEHIFLVTVQTAAREPGEGALRLVSFERLTLYGHLAPCADRGVDLGLCVCRPGVATPVATPKWHRYPPVLQTPSAVEAVHKRCLFMVQREHGAAGVALELANRCPNLTYRLVVEVDASDALVSAASPLTLDLGPGQMKFALVVVQARTRGQLEWSYSIKYSHAPAAD